MNPELCSSYQIYLSSTSFGFWDFKSKNWKKKIQKLCDEYSKESDIRFSLIDPLEVKSDDTWVVDRDLRLIAESDFVVCYMSKKVTIGTSMEIIYTSLYSKMYETEIPLIFIDPYKIHRKHPWIKKFCDYIVDNEKEAVDIIKERILNDPI